MFCKSVILRKLVFVDVILRDLRDSVRCRLYYRRLGNVKGNLIGGANFIEDLGRGRGSALSGTLASDDVGGG